MDLNQLLHRHQVSLMRLDQAESPEERRAHRQFASDYAEKIQVARNELGAPAQLQSSDDGAVEDQPANNQSGYAACVTARVVLMPTEDLTYTVVIFHDADEHSRRSFHTMREAETYIRETMPSPAPRSTLYDREADQV